MSKIAMKSIKKYNNYIDINSLQIYTIFELYIIFFYSYSFEKVYKIRKQILNKNASLKFQTKGKERK